MNREFKIVLASKSPRRKELLSSIVRDFEIRDAKTDETVTKILPYEIVEDLAWRKCSAIEKKDDELIIAADTLVFLDHEILGKPHSRENAYEMMKDLSGREHSVYTGVCIRYDDTVIRFHEKTDVYFQKLSDDELKRYIETADYMDKAGAYAIQGDAGKFISRIDGCYYNVVGLPVNRLYRELKKIDGVNLL